MSNTSQQTPNLSPSLTFLLNLARVQAIVSRYFDGHLGQGIGFNEFVILYQLSQAPGEKLRRIDLANQIGFTPSGVTRLLAPMEKIGLIYKEASEHDARVSFVLLAPSGKRIVTETQEKAEFLASEIVPSSKENEVKYLSTFLNELGK